MNGLERIQHVADVSGVGAERILQDLKGSVSGLTQTLESIARQSGGCFVDIGAKLQALHLQTDTMYRSTQGHDEILSVSEDSLLAGVAQSAKASLSHLRQAQEDNGGLFERISETLAVIRTLLKNSESIFNMGAQLEIIGINLAIQTSRHRHGTETFEDFSSEIKGFSAYTRRFAEDIQQDANDVANILGDVKKQLDEKIKYMDGFIEKADKDTAATLGVIEGLVTQTAESMSQKAHHVQNISKAVNNAIVAIQIDDITRQRMEHIKEAFERVQWETSSLDEGGAVMVLQASQLREVKSSVEAAQLEIRGGFQAIGREVSELDMLSEGDDGTAESATVSSLKHLHGTLAGLDKIHDEAEAIRRTIALSLDIAVQSSERISRHIGDVSIITQELNLKAINALLMSRNLGSGGNNLVVLAKELHSLSKESIDFVQELKGSIEHVAQVTTTLKSSILEQRQREEADHLLSAQLTAIDAAVVRLKASAQASHRMSADIDGTIADIVSGLHAFDGVLRGLDACIETLDERYRRISPYLTAGKAGNSAVMEKIFSKYTMEEERAVHRTLSGAVDDQVQKNTQDDEDDELGDFELF